MKNEPKPEELELCCLKDYFLDELTKYFIENGYKSIDKDKVPEIVTDIVDKTTAKMDDLEVNINLFDHVLHWAAELEIAKNGLKTEVSLFEIPIGEINPRAIQAFLENIVFQATNATKFHLVAGSPSLKAFRQSCDIVEAGIATCEGCRRMIKLVEAKFVGNVYYMSFRVLIAGSDLEKLHITYDVHWPCQLQ